MNAFANLVDPVSFYLIDDPNSPATGGDNSVTLAVTNLLGTYSLQYSFDDNNWTDWSPGTHFTVNTKKLMYFQIYKGSSYDTAADLTFMSHQGVYYGLDSFRSLVIDWGQGNRVTFTTPEDTDFIGTVPIPATAWLFGAGLLGLVGIRRKLRT